MTNINKIKYKTKNDRLLIFELKENIRKNKLQNAIMERRIILKNQTIIFPGIIDKVRFSVKNVAEEFKEFYREDNARSKIPKLE